MSTSVAAGLLPEVEAFLGKSPLHGWIGGQWTPSSSGETFSTFDPGTAQKLAEVHHMQPDDVERAIEAADRTFREANWARLPVNERSVLLHRLADEVERQVPIIAQLEALDAGKVLAQAEGDVLNFVQTTRYFADLAQHAERRTAFAVRGHEAWTVRHPWGPCGFIFPWNFPLLLIGWGIAPALAAGNTVVIKPAEDTPLSALYLAQLAKSVGIPDGVINVVPGYGDTTGAALSHSPRIKRMSFTGSPEVGRLIGAACGENLVPVKLELGGKGAAVVFEDVDIDETAAKLVQAITFHTGQVCCDATRWLIHRDIYDHLVSACVDRLKRVCVGYELDATTQMGPVVNEKQRCRVFGYLERGVAEGAKVVLDGGPADVPDHQGFYVRPALLAGDLSNVAAREEIFGPVAFLAPFADEEEAIRMTNNTDYGLANSVWSSDIARAQRVAEQLVAANSWVNAHNVFPHGVPYGGINKSGMGGGVLSIETLFDYWRHLSVVRPL